MSVTADPVRVGQVRRGEYGVQYQVIAIWDEWAWVHVTFPLVSGSGQPDPPVRTEPLSFLHRRSIKYETRGDE